MKLDWCVSFLSLKIRQLAGKLRAFKEDPSLWETCHKKLSVCEEEKFVSLLNVLEIEPKGTSPILPVDKNLKDDSEKTWGQIVLWSPPNKHGNNLPNAAVAVNFEEAGTYKTRFFTICFFICVFRIFSGGLHIASSRPRWLFGFSGGACMFCSSSCMCSSSSCISNISSSCKKEKLLCCRLS